MSRGEPVFDVLLAVMAEIGPATTWIAVFAAAVVVAFVVLVGVAMRATLHARDPDQRQVCYQVFHDLLDLFQGRRRR